MMLSGAGTGGAGGATGPPNICWSVNPIQPGRADYPQPLLLAPQTFSPFGTTDAYSNLQI